MQPVKSWHRTINSFLAWLNLGREKPIPIQASVQIKAAEYWLKLGEADQALRGIGSSAVEDLEMWLGAQDPDCCDGGF